MHTKKIIHGLSLAVALAALGCAASDGSDQQDTCFDGTCDEGSIIETPLVTVIDGQMTLAVPVGAGVEPSSIAPGTTFLGEVSASYGMSGDSIRSFQLDFQGAGAGQESGGGPNAFMTRAPLDLSDFLGDGWQQLRVHVWGPVGDAGRVDATYVWDISAGDSLDYETEGRIAPPMILTLEEQIVPRCCESSYATLKVVPSGEVSGAITATIRPEGGSPVEATFERSFDGYYADKVDLGTVGYAALEVTVRATIGGQDVEMDFASPGDEFREEGLFRELGDAR